MLQTSNFTTSPAVSSNRSAGSQIAPPDQSVVAGNATDPLASEESLPDSNEAGDQVVRHLSRALAFCAGKLGTSHQQDRTDEGIPRVDGQLDLDRVDEAARKFGLRIQLVELPLTLASSLAPPLIAITKSGDAVVVTSLDLKRDEAKLALFEGDSVVERLVSPRELSRRLSRALIYVAKEEKLTLGLGLEHGERFNKRHWFWSAAGRFKGNYTQVVIAGFLVNMLALASPLFVMNVYDRVIPNLTIPTLWALASGVVLALVFDFVLKTLRARLVDETGRRIDMAVSGRVFDHLLEARSDARPTSTGAMASHIRDFDNVRDVLTSSVIIAITDAIFVVIFLIVLYLIVGVLVLVPAIAAIFVLVVTMLVQFPMNRAMKEAQSDSAKRHGILIETLLSIDMLKRTGATAHMRRLFDTSVAEASRSATATRFWSNLNTTVVQSASQAVSVVLIVWGVFLVIEGQVSVGALIAANILSGRVLAPLASVSGTLARVQQAKHSYKSVDRLMALPSEWHDAIPTRPLREPSLAFEKVSYTYPQQQAPALQELSFHLEAKGRLGIIGRIGSGKSTIGHLISGICAPTDGRVLIDGVDVKQVSPVELRRFVGVVPQEPKLISGSLRDNITLGEPMASSHDIDRAVTLAGLEELARDHPQGLSMPIGERGDNLSGGQRQAVALAQTLIRRPKIVFLDEPTAALDASAEARLLKSLDDLATNENITLVLATHRHSTLACVDRLLVLEKGELLALGPIDKVMAALKKQAVDNAAMARAAEVAGAR